MLVIKLYITDIVHNVLTSSRMHRNNVQLMEQEHKNCVFMIYISLLLINLYF